VVRCRLTGQGGASRTLFGDMSMTGDSQDPNWPGTVMPGNDLATSGRATWVAISGVLLGSAIIGLLGGFVWNGVAPRAAYVVIGRGSADVVNPETTAFIASDATYCLIAVVGGLIIGIAGYQLAVRRYGPAAMAAVVVGSLIAGYVARLVGQHVDLSHFNNQLLTSRLGTILHAPPALGAEPSVIMWPAIAVWTLAACIVPAIVLIFATLQGRRSSSQPQLP
jgi:hypothetical protein